MEEKKKQEEVKKPEEEKKEEKPVDEKKEEKKGEEGKEAPPPPQEIVLRVYMHCEGCARKVKRCLKGFQGVEDVSTDCKSHKVVVKGEKADPIKVLERIQKKSHRQVELLSPIPKPPAPEEEKKPPSEGKPKPEEKKEEPPKVISVVLKVHMHCEACAQEIKKRIQRMKGVESAEPDLKGSQVTVKGVFDPANLVEYVSKRTGKHTEIVKHEPEKKEEPKEGSKDEKKGNGGEECDKDKKTGGDNKSEAAPPQTEDSKEQKSDNNEGNADTEETSKVVEIMKKNEYNYYPPRNGMEMYAYPPQIFSDENPNACCVM